MRNESDSNKICKICGDKAFINNYGILSCSSCKVFFRRHAFHLNNTYQCENNGNCKITVLTRKLCTACRFERCLAVGMNPELIRKEDMSKNNRKQKQKQRMIIQSIGIPQPRVLNLLSNDHSSLTTLDWSLISNIIHAFDIYTPIPNIQRFIGYSLNESNIEQSVNLMSTIYSSTESIISSTPDFRIMTVEEQCSLIERNMHGIWAFNSTIIFRESGVFHNRYTEKIIIPLYGYLNVQRTKNLAVKIDYDLTIIKLLMITLTFSTNCFTICDNKNLSQDNLLYGTFRLFGSQNIYAKLTWNYMIYRYGFYESAKRFSLLIKVLLDAINLASEINDNNNAHHELVDEIIEKTERSLVINEHEDISLWGKTPII